MFSNNVKYQMVTRVIRYLILLFQMFLKCQMAAHITRYLIQNFGNKILGYYIF